MCVSSHVFCLFCSLFFLFYNLVFKGEGGRIFKSRIFCHIKAVQEYDRSCNFFNTQFRLTATIPVWKLLVALCPLFKLFSYPDTHQPTQRNPKHPPSKPFNHPTYHQPPYSTDQPCIQMQMTYLEWNDIADSRHIFICAGSSLKWHLKEEGINYISQTDTYGTQILRKVASVKD